MLINRYTKIVLSFALALAQRQLFPMAADRTAVQTAQNKRFPPELFILACEYGTLDSVKKLLAAHPEINIEERNSAGQSALHRAVYRNRREIIEYLIEHHALAGALDHDHLSPLMIAAAQGNLANVMYLVEHGADMRAADKQSMTVVDYARKSDNREVVTYLEKKIAALPFFAEPGSPEQLLLNACYLRAYDKGREIIDLNPNIKVNAYSWSLETALILIASLPDPKRDPKAALSLATSLYEHDADLEAYGKVTVHGREDLTALMAAARCHNIPMISWLIEHGANANAENRWGDTPLSEALAWSGDLATVACLVQGGAQVNYSNHNGTTPLMYASLGGNTKIVAYLIAQGADVNKRNKQNATALAWGRPPNLATIMLLIQAGADVNTQDDRGKTCLMDAAEWGYYDRVAYLVSEHADVNIRDNEGKTALVKAINTREPKLREELSWRHLRWITPRERDKQAAIIANYDKTVAYLEKAAIAQSIKHALLACEEFLDPQEPKEDFPPELIDRVLKPLITATLTEK